MTVIAAGMLRRRQAKITHQLPRRPKAAEGVQLAEQQNPRDRVDALEAAKVTHPLDVGRLFGLFDQTAVQPGLTLGLIIDVLDQLDEDPYA